jgi:hypothetical protein
MSAGGEYLCMLKELEPITIHKQTRNKETVISNNESTELQRLDPESLHP